MQYFVQTMFALSGFHCTAMTAVVCRQEFLLLDE